ncbi:MAG: Mpo1-like protein [Bdellovibrionia bacterium]
MLVYGCHPSDDISMVITPRLEKWFADYETYHRHPSNKKTHYIGVPLILLSILGLASLAGEGLLNLASLAFVLVTLWAMRLDWRFGLLFGLAALPFYWLGMQLSWQINIALFVIGWIFQLVGHYKYEKKSPALTKNILQTFIGPMWIFAKVIGAR